MRFSRRLKIIFVFILLFVFIFVLNLGPTNREIKNCFYFISSPIQKFFWQTGNNLSDFFRGLFDSKNLAEENKELRIKNKELKSKEAIIEELREENKILREALNLGLKEKFELRLARIIGKDISQDSILINKGWNEGIKPNLPVITSQNILVGKVKNVYENFSEVILISNRSSSFDARILEDSTSSSDIWGVIKGKGSGRISFEFIPREKEIRIGNEVVTGYLGGDFPSGLLVGEVKKIERSDTSPFQRAELKWDLNPNELDSLFIIINFHSKDD